MMNKLRVFLSIVVIATASMNANAFDRITTQREMMCTTNEELQHWLQKHGESIVVGGTSGTVFAGEQASFALAVNTKAGTYSALLISKTYACVLEIGTLFKRA